MGARSVDQGRVGVIGRRGIGRRMVKGSDLIWPSVFTGYHISCNLVLPHLILSIPFTFFTAYEMR
jgi:hypothetical protein